MDGRQEAQTTAGNRINPFMAAALLGSGIAAAAGAWFGTRALARRNCENGRPLNSVMAAAITACEVAHEKPKE